VTTCTSIFLDFFKYHLVEFKLESILVGKGITSYFCFENSNFDHALCI
jgi:hypothetical protein